MGIYGTGIITNLVMSQDPDWYPAYRWDKEGTPYYELRPDRFFARIRGGAPDIALLPILVHNELRGVGGPSGDTPTSTAASKRPSESRKAVKAQSAHGFRKTKGVSARGKCPKGHYWSYREKKCVKSKFR